MANPRKFSEKIALHHQKQLEGTAAFEQIIREVSDATNKVCAPRCDRQLEDGGQIRAEAVSADTSPGDGVSMRLMPGLGAFRGGSLPNVAAVAPCDASALAQIKPEDCPLGGYLGGGASPVGAGGAGAASPGGAGGGRTAHRGRAPASSSVGPMRARPADRKHDTSPYGSSVYLSPPPDSSWRRTNSDSALHQSSSLTAQPSSPHHHPHHNNTLNAYPFHNALGPGLQQHHSHSQQSLHMSHHQHNAQSQQDHRRGVTDSNHLENMLAMITNPNRPRSSCEMPRVPGISVYPSQEAGGGAGPPGPGPGAEGPQLAVPPGPGTGSLPDLTSLHYHGLPQHQPHQQHQQQHSPRHADNAYLDDHSSSPYSSSPISASPATLSPTQLPPLRQPSARSYGPPSPGSQVGGPTLSGPYSPTGQNHLSVPNSNRYLQHNNHQGISLEQGWIQAGYQQQCSPPSLHSSHSNINVSSPTMSVPPSQICGSPNSRSPAGGSPGDSPQPQSQSQPQNANLSDAANSDAYYISHALQQHFEQFSMMDTPASNYNYVNNGSPSQSHYTQSPLREGGAGCEGGPGGALLGGRGRCAGGACAGCPACLERNHHPPTPAAIPDIVLTDFSSGGCGGCGLFEEELRSGLGPLDLDGLHMLSDPEASAVDPAAEDAFRLDRL